MAESANAGENSAGSDVSSEPSLQPSDGSHGSDDDEGGGANMLGLLAYPEEARVEATQHRQSCFYQPI